MVTIDTSDRALAKPIQAPGVSPLVIAWSKDQIASFVRQVRQHTGQGWNWIVPELRAALIAQKALTVLTSVNERGELPAGAAGELYARMLEEAKLE